MIRSITFIIDLRQPDAAPSPRPVGISSYCPMLLDAIAPISPKMAVTWVVSAHAFLARLAYSLERPAIFVFSAALSLSSGVGPSGGGRGKHGSDRPPDARNQRTIGRPDPAGYGAGRISG